MQQRSPEVEPQAEFAINNRPAPDFNISNLYLPEADMTGDVYEPETDTESESGEVEVVSIGWSRTHPSSATYTIPTGGFVTAQVTEHASWIENERHWEETYQVKYYFSTSPPPQWRHTSTLAYTGQKY